MKAWQQRLLRSIPPVNEILALPALQRLGEAHSRDLVTRAVQESLDEVRRQVLAAAEENGLAVSPEALAARAAARLRETLRPRLRRVINATGVVLHTNMGRSSLPEAALEQVIAVARHYSNLELDLATGERGERYAHVEDLICRITGGEAAHVVNNGAAAVLLALAALAAGREVIVSRGELVEIGGSFRIPEVMAQSGARLVEVGATNKARLADYARAVTEQTAALLKVHTSNYRIIGFHEEVAAADLVALGRKHELPVLNDLGSGVLVDLGLGDEPTVQQMVAAGCDLVTFSGDKLLGGPQAGILVGRRDLVERCKKHPLTRALRIDKLTLAALEGTLKLYLDPEVAGRHVPTLRMLRAGPSDLEPLAQALAAALKREAGARASVEVMDGVSQAGGGSLPGTDLPTRLVAVRPLGPSAQAAEARLRQADPPVLCRIAKDRLLFDVRTMTEDEIPLVARALGAALA